MYCQLFWLILSLVNLQPNAANDLKTALNDFSLNFLKGYHQNMVSKVEKKHDNLLYSPISLASALSLLVAGSKGPTQQQLVDLFGYDDLVKNNSLEVAFKKLKDEDFDIQDSDDNLPVVKMANRVYLKEDIKLLDDFLQIVKNSYDADLVAVESGRDPKQLVEEINKWIASKTGNKLQNVLKKLKPDFVMVLINVIYFKATWKESFDKEREIHQKEFTNSNGEKKEVDMLTTIRDYPYGEFERYKILKLDYLGNCAMYVMLPNKNVNLNDLLRELDTRKLNNEIGQLRTREIDLMLPKFKLESDIDLQPILKQLGVKIMFTKWADFSRISKSDLMVSQALQGGFISVNENGTEAAAATIVEFTVKSSLNPEPTPKFYANRPFIFIIRLNNLNIFAGVVKRL